MTVRELREILVSVEAHGNGDLHVVAFDHLGPTRMVAGAYVCTLDEFQRSPRFALYVPALRGDRHG